MKNKSRFLIIFVLLYAAGIANAMDVSCDPSTKVFDSNTFTLDLTNVNQANIQITLTDVDGLVLYEETLLKTSIENRKYNLESLPFGFYFLTIAYDRVLKIQPIKKGSEILEIDNADLMTVFQPAFRHRSGYLELNMLSFSGLNVSLLIKDSGGHIIYDEIVQINGALQRRYNLLQLEPGAYTYTLSFEENFLNYEFEESIFVTSNNFAAM